MDGFTGNVALKASETLAESLMHLHHARSCSATPLRKLGALLSQRRLPRGASGASTPPSTAARRCSGVKGCCVIGHGSSNAVAIKHGIRAAAEFFTSGVNERIEAELRALGARARSARPRRQAARVSVAFVFPGQGSQKVGMGRALAEAFPESRAVFDEADAALGFAALELCFEGPEDELQLTANTQPAILAASVAALRALEARGRARRTGWPGHSLGEYSALVAAGRLSLADAVRRGAAARPVHAGGGAGRARAPWRRSSASTSAADRGGLPRGGPGRGRVAREHQLARARS